MITIVSDYSDADHELDRLINMPTFAMAGYLDSALDISFQDSRAKVHIDTGKLKRSGKKRIRDSRFGWSGQFSFLQRNKKGTPYGVYERARGGAHDFLGGASGYTKLFVAAMVEGLKKKR